MASISSCVTILYPPSSATENAVDILSAMVDKSILVVAANEKKLTSFNSPLFEHRQKDFLKKILI